jgi:hypothetical protein
MWSKLWHIQKLCVYKVIKKKEEQRKEYGEFMPFNKQEILRKRKNLKKLPSLSMSIFDIIEKYLCKSPESNILNIYMHTYSVFRKNVVKSIALSFIHQ